MKCSSGNKISQWILARVPCSVCGAILSAALFRKCSCSSPDPASRKQMTTARRPLPTFPRFARLKDAINERKEVDYIFAQDLGSNGAKLFFLATKSDFVERYNRDLCDMETSTQQSALNIYEVLTGACRMYFDVDKCTFDDFFGILSWIKTTFPTEQLRIFHREGDRLQSFHIVGSSTYSSPSALGVHVRSKRPPEHIDMAVYTRNRCWKLPFSRKFGRGKPMIPFCLGHKSQISEHDLVDLSVRYGITSLPSVSTSMISPMQDGRSFVTETLPLQILDQLTSIYGDVSSVTPYLHGAVKVNLRTKVCDIAMREHSHNHIFLIYDPSSNRYAQSCHNEECRARPLRWKVLYD